MLVETFKIIVRSYFPDILFFNKGCTEALFGDSNEYNVIRYLGYDSMEPNNDCVVWTDQFEPIYLDNERDLVKVLKAYKEHYGNRYVRETQSTFWGM